MNDSKTREKVLKKIRQSLIHKTDNPYPVIDLESKIYDNTHEHLDVLFAEQFTKVNGSFCYCENETAFTESLIGLAGKKNWPGMVCKDEKLKKLLKECNIPVYDNEPQAETEIAGITCCEYLVARTGSILVSSQLDSGRKQAVFPDVHVVAAYTSQLVYNIRDALQNIKAKYSQHQNFPSLISLITGPSRTADIEKTLVKGAHGPREIFVFLIENNS